MNGTRDYSMEAYDGTVRTVGSDCGGAMSLFASHDGIPSRWALICRGQP